MSETVFNCAQCGGEASQPNSAVNRARKCGYSLSCSKACSALSRRKDKPKAQRVAEKRIYDMAYREQNRDLLKAKK